jgi:hypothetical protein
MLGLVVIDNSKSFLFWVTGKSSGKPEERSTTLAPHILSRSLERVGELARPRP